MWYPDPEPGSNQGSCRASISLASGRSRSASVESRSVHPDMPEV